MKRTQKKILGCFGLGVVVATTFVAATMPSSGAFAEGPSSVTDVIQVRVVGSTPNVTVSGITNGEGTVDQNQSIKVDYENVSRLTIQLKQTKADGTVIICPVKNFTDDELAAPGSYTANLDLNNLGNGCGGYGKYEVQVIGVGGDGVTPTENFITFEYWPAVIDDVTKGEGQYPEVYFDDDNDEINHIKVVITDDKGVIKWEKDYPPTTAQPITDIPIDEMEPGEYVISVTAYGDADENTIIYQTFYRNWTVTPTKVPSTGAPDTGGLFQNLNISKEDYLITGLLVFFVFGVIGFAIVAKNHSHKSTRRRK